MLRGPLLIAGAERGAPTAQEHTMQKGINLIELAEKIEANRTMKADFVAPANQLRMTTQDDGTVVVAVPTLGELPVLPLAHQQIGTFTEIPNKYYQRLLTQAPDLLAANVNRWFVDKSEGRMLRTLGGDMRAFLSNRYQRIEHEEIAAMALPVLRDYGAELVSCELTDRKMHLIAILPHLQAELKVDPAKRARHERANGEIMRCGVSISNSEIGLGAAKVQGYLERLACYNGATIADTTLMARHVGRRIEDSEDLNSIFSDETRQADDRTILLKMRDMIKHCLDETTFRARIERMSELTEGKVTGNPTKAVEMLTQKIGATVDEGAGILRSLIEGGDLSPWGLVNAVTYQAHGAPTYDRAIEWTEIGGKLLSLPKREWKAILEAE
jgi:hypothetical protein